MKTLHMLGAITLAAVGGLMLASTAQADNMRVSGLGNYGSLNMRSGPSTGYHVVSRIPAGSTHINWTCRTSRTGNSTWYQIDWNGQRGWASSRYLRYMRGSHRHCNAVNPTGGGHGGHGGHGGTGGPGGSGSGGGTGHGHTHTTHTHTHSHNGYSHSHGHTHNGSTSHDTSGHGGTTTTTPTTGCHNAVFGALTMRLCP